MEDAPAIKVNEGLENQPMHDRRKRRVGAESSLAFPPQVADDAEGLVHKPHTVAAARKNAKKRSRHRSKRSAVSLPNKVKQKSKHVLSTPDESLEGERKAAAQQVDELLYAVAQRPYVPIQINHHSGISTVCGAYTPESTPAFAHAQQSSHSIELDTSPAKKKGAEGGVATAKIALPPIVSGSMDKNMVSPDSEKPGRSHSALKISQHPERRVNINTVSIVSFSASEFDANCSYSHIPPLSSRGKIQKILPGNFVNAFSRRCTRTLEDIYPADCTSLHSSPWGPRSLFFLSGLTTPQAAVSNKNAMLKNGGHLAVTIHGMSPLPSDGRIVHPFVRVWLLDCQTGENLLAEEPCGSPTQSLTPSRQLCGTTHPFDLRQRATRSPWWEAELNLPLPCFSSEPKRAVLLFEVCDAGTESIFGTHISRKGLDRLCWGYWMLFGPNGDLQLPSTYLHVQLYSLPEKRRWWDRLWEQILPISLASSAVYAPSVNSLDVGHVLCDDTKGGDNNKFMQPWYATPYVFRVFQELSNRKIPFRGGLVASVRYEPPTVSSAQEERCFGQTLMPSFAPSMLAYEAFLLEQLVACDVAAFSPVFGTPFSDLDSKKDMHLSNRITSGSCLQTSLPHSSVLFSPGKRDEGQRVLLPTEILGTHLVEGVVTCMTMSHYGKVLALGLNVTLSHVIELRDPISPDFNVMARLKGHTGSIHSIVFCLSDACFVSCSADMTVRVWIPKSLGECDDYTGELNLFFSETICVMVLPHPFPVYHAAFHQGHILTCGCNASIHSWYISCLFDETRGWQWGRNRDEESNFDAHSIEEASHITESVSTEAASPIIAPTSGAKFQLISKVSNEDDVAIISISSNEKGNYVWTLSSSGCVTCWRAVYEKQRRERKSLTGQINDYEGLDERRHQRYDPHAQERRVWHISARSRVHHCPEATHISMEGKYVVVGGRDSIVAYIIDSVSGEQRAIPSPGFSLRAPIQLLADGEAFVTATDKGVLHAWECIDGGACTPSVGYTPLRIPHGVHQIAWASKYHLCAFASVSPLPVPSQQALRERSQSGVEQTAVTLAAVGPQPKVILLSSGDASATFALTCGSPITTKRRTAVSLAKAKERNRNKAVDKNRNMLLYDVADMGEQFSEQLSLQQQERYSRIDFIIGFWKGLTRLHRHEKSEENKEDEERSRAEREAEREKRRNIKNMEKALKSYIQVTSNEDNINI